MVSKPFGFFCLFNGLIIGVNKCGQIRIKPKCLVPFPACLCRGPPKDFEIKFVLNNGRNKFSFSCPRELRYFATLES